MTWNDDTATPQTPEDISRNLAWFACLIAAIAAFPVLAFIFLVVLQ